MSAGSPELQSIPWGIGTQIRPSHGEEFEPFEVAAIIYPKPSDLLRSLSDYKMRSLLQDEEGGNADFVRVVLDQNGRVHTRYRHIVTRGGHTFYELRHHGGKLGAWGVQPVIDQCDRILDRILGFKFSPEVQQRLQVKGEEEENIIRPKITFSAALIGLRATVEQVTVPGEKALMGEYLDLTERAMRDITLPFPPQDNVVRRIKLLETMHRQLQRKKVPPMRVALENLKQFLTIHDDEMALDLLRKMEGNFYDRLEELSGVTAGVMRRRLALEDFRAGQERIVDHFYDRVMRTTSLLNSGLTEQSLIRQVDRFSSDAQEIYLSRLILQPYKEKADKLLQQLRGLRQALAERSIERIARAFQQVTLDLEPLERLINREILGRPKPTA